nr:hypothetical protein [Solirhodobacter olei]
MTSVAAYATFYDYYYSPPKALTEKLRVARDLYPDPLGLGEIEKRGEAGLSEASVGGGPATMVDQHPDRDRSDPGCKHADLVSLACRFTAFFLFFPF